MISVIICDLPAPVSFRHVFTRSSQCQRSGPAVSPATQWLKNWLRRRLNCSQSAADLAQDTFMRLLAKEQVPELHAPRTFLAKVAQSVLMQSLPPAKARTRLP